jgi:hypothetical protein
MRAREIARSSARQRSTVVLLLAALVALAGLAPALAEANKKKPKPGARTVSFGVPFSSASTRSETATCPKKTHLTGGGFAVTPHFDPTLNSGLRSVTTTSHPVGARNWTASGSAYDTPPATGIFAAYVRCERNAFARLAVTLSSSATVPPGQAANMVLDCPRRAHVVTGGYSGTGIVGFNHTQPSYRIIPLQSRRTGPREWTVFAANSAFASEGASITAYAVCERNGKGQAVSQASTTSTLAENGRTMADASCPGKRHVVSGGFALSPIPTGAGAIPVTAIDEFQPVGSRGWHLGLHESTLFGLPPGGAVQMIAYCKQGK